MARPAQGPQPASSARCKAIVLAATCLAATLVQAAPGTTLPYSEAPPPHLQAAANAVAGAAWTASAPPLPRPAATTEVALGGILAYADAHSPVLSIARSTRSRAEAARAAASPLLPSNPEVTIGAGWSSDAPGVKPNIEASLAQQIQVAGERGLRLEAADRLGTLTDAEIEQFRWAVHCDVHAAFHRAIIERERVRLNERISSFQTDLLRIVEHQIEAGETAPLTLRLAQAELAQARQGVVAAQQSYLVARIRLAQLAGWPVAKPPSPAGSVDAPREPPALEQLAGVARERLPSLRAGVARVQEAAARVAVADRQVWPRPTLGVQYRREGSPAPGGLTSTVIGVVALPIPSFQLNQGERAWARADVAVAEAQLGAARLLLEGQIAEARSEVIAATQRTLAYGSEILPRFDENLTLLRRSFELGEIDILALSAGRERFLRIQSDALGAQLDYFVALAGLERVVGVDLWRDDHHEESTP